MSQLKRKGETTPAVNHRLHKKSRAWCWVGIIPLLIFHTLADFETSAAWNAIYFLWSHIIVATAALLIVLYAGIWKEFFSYVIYLFLRVCIEIIIIIKGANPNIGWAVNILYFAALLPILYQTFIQMKREWQQSKSSLP